MQKLCRVSLVLVTFALGLVYPAPDAFACSCVDPPPDQIAVRQSDTVFAGRIVDAARPWLSEGRGRLAYAVDVEAVYNGTVYEKQWIYTETGAKSPCPFEIDPGTRYLVFADGAIDDLSVGACSWTRAIDSDEELNLQAAGTILSGRSRRSPPDLLWALVSIAVGVVAYAAGKKKVFEERQPAHRAGG